MYELLIAFILLAPAILVGIACNLALVKTFALIASVVFAGFAFSDELMIVEYQSPTLLIVEFLLFFVALGLSVGGYLQNIGEETED